MHPTAQHLLTPTARIADIACGMASWLRDVAAVAPSSAQLHGYDLRPEHPKAALPSNVHLYGVDVKEGFPPALHGMYDFVNVRLLCGGLTADDWPVVVRNLTQLLKPGGMLQWLEPDVLDCTVESGTPPSTKEGLQGLLSAFVEMMTRKRVLDRDHGLYVLPALMKDAGLASVRDEVVSSESDPGVRRMITEATGFGMFHSLAHIVEKEGEDKGPVSLARVGELEKMAIDDVESGSHIKFGILVRVGTKAK